MSTPSSKRKPLIGNSPFQKFTGSVEAGNEALKEARQIDMSLINTNPRQPRRTFDEQSLKELAADIEARGILQPPIVRPVEGNRYEIVVGERRYRAANLLGLKSIPVLVRALDDQEAEITSLIENIQRENLSLNDEAAYFNMLKTKYGYSIREIAENVAHKSAGYVDVRLKLAEHPEVLQMVESDQIGIQKANHLMRLDDKALQTELKRLQNSLNSSQSVFGKDSSLDSSQLKEVDETREAARHATLLAKPFVVISREISKVATRYEQSATAERAAILDSLDQLEQEIVRLKRKLKDG